LFVADIIQLQWHLLNLTTTSTYNGVLGAIRPSLIGSYTTGAELPLINSNIPYIHATAWATSSAAAPPTPNLSA
jgi:hypothetical protein